MKKAFFNPKKLYESTRGFLVKLLAISTVIIVNAGCHGDDGTIQEAEGYIVGGDHCFKGEEILTPFGKGRTYLIETVSPDNQTLLVFGVPAGLYDIPSNWLGYYSFPEEEKRNFKVRILYREVKSPQDDYWSKNTICTLDLPSIIFQYPNVVAVSTRRVD